MLNETKASHTTIPIVMATDENFAMPTCVAIESMLSSKHNDSSYQIHIMIPEEFSETIQGKFKSLLVRYPGTEIKYIVMGASFSDAYIPESRFAAPAYYRLAITEKLPELDKCIFLDGDIIVCRDLSELFSYDLGSSYAAGVRDDLSKRTQQWYETRCKKLGIDSYDQYINSGVLLLNLKEMRKNDVYTKFTQLLNKEFSKLDQDIINAVFYNKIMFLPPEYNFRFNYLEHLIKSKIFTSEEIKRARFAPTVIHFLGIKKPWNSLQGNYFELWRKFGLSSPFSDEVLDMYNELSEIEKGRKRSVLKVPQILYSKIKYFISISRSYGLLNAIEIIMRKYMQKMKIRK